MTAALDPPYDAGAASEALAEADPRLGAWIARVGPPTLELRPAETFEALLRSIVFQQLSTKAAATIHGRVVEAFGDGGGVSPEAILRADDAALRACGLSRAKTAAVRDLAARRLDGSLPTRSALLGMPDPAVVEVLTAVRGVGVWTAQMVLLFNLGRPDVWPTTDLGVQEGYRIIAGLDERPGPRELAAMGEPYAPWRSVAAWYGWRTLHLVRDGGALE